MYFGITNAKIVGFISTFFLLVLSYLLLFYNTKKLTDQSYDVDHTNKVIVNLEYLASENKEIEYYYRGFIALNTTNYYDRFFITIKKTDSLYNLVRELVSDNPIQIRRMDTMRTALDIKFSTMTDAIEFFKATPQKQLYADSFYKVGYVGPNVGVMRRQIRLMQYFEGALLKSKTEKATKFSTTIQWIIGSSGLIAFVLAISSFFTYRKESKARKKADENSELYRKELESRVNELAVANKEIREFKEIEKFAATGRIARTIAHEVRNPLTNINLATEQLKDSLVDNDDNNMLLEMVKRNGLRINQLISNLLNATKFSELSFEKVDIHEVIDDALELAEDRISLKQIKIEKKYTDQASEIKLDEEKIKIAFLNIIVNAIEAMENQKGILSIQTNVIDKKCKIEFTDNGVGMNPEMLSKLFEPYFTNKENGNGLGLTNTQNIILNHKGSLDVQSEEGVGTIFTIILDTD